jgi:hypothetical protein
MVQAGLKISGVIADVSRLACIATALFMILLCASCTTKEQAAGLGPEEIRKMIPQYVTNDRDLWAQDIHDCLMQIGVEPSVDNVGAIIAVIDQESSFQEDPRVPHISDILIIKIEEIRKNPILRQIVNFRLDMTSGSGKTFRERIWELKTEKDFEDWYVEFTASRFTGPVLKLFGKDIDGLVKTIGSMQVSVDYAKRNAGLKEIYLADFRNELYTRKAGILYGASHLFDYENSYDDIKYRFADYNAGQYSSRNAGFQFMVASLSGIQLDLDGDLGAGDADAIGIIAEYLKKPLELLPFEVDRAGILYKIGGAAENNAVLKYTAGPIYSLAGKLEKEDMPNPDDAKGSKTYMATLKALRDYGCDVSAACVAWDFRKQDTIDFESTKTYKAIIDTYSRTLGTPSYAMIPQIVLKSDKFKRHLTTEWFAESVNKRYTKNISRYWANV